MTARDFLTREQEARLQAEADRLTEEIVRWGTSHDPEFLSDWIHEVLISGLGRVAVDTAEWEVVA